MHHTQLLQELIDAGKLRVEGGALKGNRIYFSRPLHLGRGNENTKHLEA